MMSPLNSLLNFFFPRFCHGCGWPGSYLCAKCGQKILDHPQICPECGRVSKYGLTHPGCQTPQGLNGFWSWTSYGGLAKKFVEDIKYRYYYGLINDFLAYCPFIDFSPVKKGVSAVTPIPLHWLRKKQRGFNQSASIARFLGAKFNLPVVDLLTRKYYTVPQVKIANKEQRQKNLRGVFEIKQNNPLPNSVLLVDDVATSLATLKEACKVLKRNKIPEVYGFTLCHGR